MLLAIFGKISGDVTRDLKRQLKQLKLAKQNDDVKITGKETESF
jgi:hypothetical protein